MTTDIQESGGGQLIELEGKRIFFPNAEILNVGCRNCIWKLHGQCPYGLHDEQSNTEGICNDMLHFLTTLSDKEGTLNSIWENYHIYKLRIQESEDYKDFLHLRDKVRKAYSAGDLSHEELCDLEADRNAAKLWWLKLNQFAIMSLQKVNDRSVKIQQPMKLPGIMSAKTINFNITKEIEDKNK